MLDDILISTTNKLQLLQRVRSVLDRFRKAGLKLKKDKCAIATPHIKFLGYKVDASGIHPTKSKVRAIHDAPTPLNKMDLQAFLGLLNFYASFLPHKASIAEPLRRLLDKQVIWHWGPKEAHAFKSVKSLITSNAVHIQFNKDLPLVLAADASPFGIGAVLSHRLPNGFEAPIAFFSRTLSAAEHNYSQIDKEALTATASVKKFHEFLYGHHFDLITDHKPLLGLLAGDRQTPQILLL
uniref:ribonuclease H n=1 Tax=Micrurus surinamensis TaxID=129470 RepID=A0A2D4PIV7_MICSU